MEENIESSHDCFLGSRYYLFGTLARVVLSHSSQNTYPPSDTPPSWSQGRQSDMGLMQVAILGIDPGEPQGICTLTFTNPPPENTIFRKRNHCSFPGYRLVCHFWARMVFRWSLKSRSSVFHGTVKLLFWNFMVIGQNFKPFHNASINDS